MTKSFFLTLVSNVKHDTFLNRTGDFMNRLPTPLHLSEAYEVGVSQVIYTNSFYSLQKSSDTAFYYSILPYKHLNPNEVSYNLEREEIIWKDLRFPLRKCLIPEGHYTKAEDFIHKLNGALPLKHRNSDIIFAFNQERAVLTVTVKVGFLVLLPFEHRSTRLLGFNSSFLFSGHHEAAFPLVLSNLTHFYIATDCIAPSYFGDKTETIICTVPIEQSVRNTNCEYFYERVQYHPVLSEFLSNIRVRVLNAELEPLVFQTGNCYIQLHFRKIKLPK